MLKDTDVFLVLGRRGCGKSYLARRLSEPYPRQVVIDPLGEHGADADSRVCVGFDEITQALIDHKHSPAFRLIYRPDIEAEDTRAEFNELMRVLWYRGNVFIHIEEIQLYCSSHSMPHWLKQALLTGRHRKLGLMFTTQRPGECHKTIVAMAGHVFCGSTHEKNDVEYTRSVLGDRAFELQTLPERQFFYYRPARPLLKVSNELKTLDSPSESP